MLCQPTRQCTATACAPEKLTLTPQYADHRRRRDAPSIVLPHQDAEYIRHIAIDIGGSLIKLVYFSPEEVADNGGDASSHRQNAGGAQHGSSLLQDILTHSA